MMRADNTVLELAPPDSALLTEALAAEERLLSELHGILRRQREGIAADDLEVVDGSVFAAHRVLGTLREAQIRRRTLMAILTGSETTPLHQLETILGDEMTLELAETRDRVSHEARILAREIRINRRVLEGALEQGNRLIQVLSGAVTSGGGLGGADHGALLDRQV